MNTIIKRSMLDNTEVPNYEVFGTAVDFDDAVAKVKLSFIEEYGVLEDEIEGFFEDLLVVNKEANTITFEDVFSDNKYEFFVF